VPEPPIISPDPSADMGVRARGSLRWGAIALGAAVDVAGTRLCTSAISMVIGIRTAVLLQTQTAPDPAAAQANLQGAFSGHWLDVLFSATGLLCSVAGGYLAAYMAKTAVLLNAAVTGTCSAIVGLLMLGGAGGSSPMWSQVALAAVTVPVAMLGGLLGRPARQRS